MKPRWIYLDGKFVPWEKANIHILTHSLHYGTAVFEGIRAYKTKKGIAIFRGLDHAERLISSAKAVGLGFKLGKHEVIRIMVEAMKRNRHDSAYIRPIVFLGSNVIGLSMKHTKVRFAVMVLPFTTYLGKKETREGISCGISTHRKIKSEAIPQTIKASANYLVSTMATEEVRKAGYEEAILLNSLGRVAEGSGENLIIVKGGKLFTPPLSEDVLDGITKKSIQELAEASGLEFIEKPITLAQLFSADEAFFTGTAAAIVPIKSVNGKKIGSGKRGEITRKMQKLYENAVTGRDKRFDKWPCCYV